MGIAGFLLAADHYICKDEENFPRYRYPDYTVAAWTFYHTKFMVEQFT